MGHFAGLVWVVAIVLATSLAGPLVSPSANAQDASPAAESGPPPGLVDETLAVGLTEALPEAPAIVLMQRVTIAPGADIPGSPDDPGFSFFRIESGMLTVRTDSPLSVVRAAALAEALATPGTMPTMEEISADAEFTLAAGDSVTFPPGVGGSLRNDGSEPVVLLTTQIFPAGA
jgi:mannose-6-phosphate isomerase-like protein (cupin superfamily)